MAIGTDGVLFDLLMAVMNSPVVWAAAAGEADRGMAWRDAVTARMAATTTYTSYEELVADAAAEVGLPGDDVSEVRRRWAEMEPWPDAHAIAGLSVPYAFVTNCSAELARIATERSGLDPGFTLSAEEAGWYKPAAPIYHEACRRLGFTPDRTAFVAGAPYDAAGAQAAGLQAWQVMRRDDQRPALPSARVARALPDVLARIRRG